MEVASLDAKSLPDILGGSVRKREKS
jgi:hypothetical protein